MKKRIITIERQYGSGGSTIGRLVAEKLGINCYNRQILEMTAEKCARGIRRFVMGLGKKLLISNTAALIADAAFNSFGAEEISSLFAWAGAVCYCIQLYFDFSGYSDMAIGLAEMFGFTICENFNYP